MDELPIPKYSQGSLADFIADLRTWVFKSKVDAARSFNLHHATIGRYEAGEIRAPLGYLACLIKMFAEKRATKKHSPSEFHKELLTEANKAVRADYYLDAHPFQAWDDLVQTADDYLAERKAAAIQETPEVPGRDIGLKNQEIPGFEEVLQPLAKAINPLPAKIYSELVGRDKFLRDIMSDLRDPAGRSLIGIDGMGGIGKTALAREVAERCQLEGLFERFIWIQAPKESFALSEGDKGIGSLTFEAALDHIARQLGALDVPKLKLAEKELRIKALLQSQRVLVVMDNLETSKEPQEDIARALHNLLSPSKALLTSRRRFKVDLFTVHLDGLILDDAIRFARRTARDRNFSHVENAEREELSQVAETTGGSPLAIKLVVGQLETQSLEAVLNQLSKVKPPDQDSDEDDYLKFYKFIFAESWRLLSTQGKELLISMSHFAPNVGGTYDAVKATSDLSDQVLQRCIEELWRFSFLERGESPSLKIMRYYLHALTQYFVLSDIVKVIK